MLRIPHCLDNRLTVAVRLSALRAGRRFTPQKHYVYAFGTHFCLRLNKPHGLLRPEGLGKLVI
jgi:hypothetical protein